MVNSLCLSESYQLEHIGIPYNGSKIHLYKDTLRSYIPSNIQSNHIPKYVENKISERKIDISKLLSKKVRYFSPEEREATRVSLNEKGQLCQIGIDRQGDPRPLDRGIYIFALNGDELCIARKEKSLQGRIQHSSFFAGRDIHAAGYLMIAQAGRIAACNCSSGHYRPNAIHLQQLATHLKATLPEKDFKNIQMLDRPLFRNKAIFFLLYLCLLAIIFFKAAGAKLSVTNK